VVAVSFVEVLAHKLLKGQGQRGLTSVSLGR